ncbi:glycosyl transferase family protein [Sphingomicrobium flavum]|uniref:glycosyl transferase family protein n=1 Tax=Sphingomicrobium flavum TaxID=1229164 RepID=UPI0021ADC0CD|nr:glycosyl transferase family protein [Sphingomicrobium flavum]
MSLANILALVAGELALFAACGFILFALDDLLVDILYFTRRLWRSATVYRKYPRAFARDMQAATKPGWIAVFVPAWDESAVIDNMLRSTIERWGAADFKLFVGYYRNDPATAAAIMAVEDERIVPVMVDADGPTTKADCLNNLHDALLAEETHAGRAAKAVLLHDAEDLVHPLELALFDRLVERAAAVQLPVVPLIHPSSRWISGHYCDEFAESHGKELVVREAVGASIPLAGVACAIERSALARLATQHEGKPFSGESQTEDYELGLRLGAMGERTMFVRIPAIPGDDALVASHGHFPADLDSAIRQKARWIGGIAFSGWDRLGWRGGLGERWMRMRDRRGPFAALVMFCGYLAAFLWGQLWIAEAMGAPVAPRIDPTLKLLLLINAAFLIWRLVMRFAFTARIYGVGQGLLAIPRLFISNAIAMLAAKRAFASHLKGGPKQWDKTRHIFPEPQS